MPSKTFTNLDTKKQQRIIAVALREFAAHDYETASITQIVKNAGIAKGSLYQYFENKLEFLSFLHDYANGRKAKFLASVSRLEHPDFWNYKTAQLRAELDFDRKDPLCSQLLYRIETLETSVLLRKQLKAWKTKNRAAIAADFLSAATAGAIRSDISVDTLVHYYVEVKHAIAKLSPSVQNTEYAITTPEEQQKTEQAISDMIALIQRAMQPE